MAIVPVVGIYEKCCILVMYVLSQATIVECRDKFIACINYLLTCFYFAYSYYASRAKKKEYSHGSWSTRIPGCWM